MDKTVLTIKETVQRAKARGMPISEYTLRRAIRSGAIPCRIVGKKYLIAWPKVERWLMCEDGADNTPRLDTGGIRPIIAEEGRLYS